MPPVSATPAHFPTQRHAIGLACRARRSRAAEITIGRGRSTRRRFVALLRWSRAIVLHLRRPRHRRPRPRAGPGGAHPGPLRRWRDRPATSMRRRRIRSQCCALWCSAASPAAKRPRLSPFEGRAPFILRRRRWFGLAAPLRSPMHEARPVRRESNSLSTMTSDKPDKRQTTRRPITHAVFMATGLGPPLKCQMLDVSELGARLRVGDPKVAPKCSCLSSTKGWRDGARWHGGPTSKSGSNSSKRRKP